MVIIGGPLVAVPAAPGKAVGAPVPAFKAPAAADAATVALNRSWVTHTSSTQSCLNAPCSAVTLVAAHLFGEDFLDAVLRYRSRRTAFWSGPVSTLEVHITFGLGLSAPIPATN
jgi:hypothetical protein